MKLLPLTGKINHKIGVVVGYSKIDNEDYPILSRFNWSYQGKNKDKYITNTRLGELHRFIMGHPKGLVIDHKNHNILDNRKKNLRICTQGENVKNTSIKSNNKSGFKCISRSLSGKCWEVRVKNNGKIAYHGNIKNLRQAIKLRNKLLLKLHGEYARFK